ncbi:MAG: ABC transporter ATP-binding protein/permease [Tatlockia sp.]|nr:ABC transporter ATP-binding protein/permease [Tatlockia sp.]
MKLKIENQISADTTTDLDITKETEVKPPPRPITWSERFNLIKDYFVNSDEKWIAWLQVGGIVFCVIGVVALTFVMGWLFTGLMAALTASLWTPFLIAIGELVAVFCGLAILNSLQQYLSGKLAINWRNWLTNHFIKLIDPLEVKRTSPGFKNISQRVQEDIKNLVNLSLSLSTDFLKSSLNLIVFITMLWIVGGSLAFIAFGLNIVIPGYLVWIALLIAVAACVISYYMGKPLAELNQKEEQVEADLRQHLETMHLDAENIGLEKTQQFHLNTIETDNGNLKDNGTQTLKTQTALGAFQTLYIYFSLIIPYLVAAPLYFKQLISFDKLSEIGSAFAQVNFALSWFAGAREKSSLCLTKADRLIEIQHAIDAGILNSNPKSILIKEKDKKSIKIKGLTIQKPLSSSTSDILRNLNLKLKKGEHTMIAGESGTGKSTLLKILGRSWEYGEGKIRLPKGKIMTYLPQIPTLTYNSFKGLLAHPHPVSRYSEGEYLAVISAVQMNMEDIPDLDLKQDWFFLSGGERQRISFAKALLQKPDWLFLDEVTAFLDEESEEYLYKLLMSELKETTVVSIAHRSTVRCHHQRFIKLGPSKENVMEIVVDERLEQLSLAM